MSVHRSKRMQQRSSKRWLIWLLTAVLALGAAGCGAADPASESSGGPAAASLPDATVRGVDNKNRGMEEGQLAPDFLMKSEDGATVKLSDWRGQPVVVNFWATWCAPCKAEMPEFVAAYDKYQADGLVILGVNAQESAQQAAEFVEKFGMRFPVTLDSRGEIQDLYTVRGLPTTIFIDRDGMISARWAGLLTPELLEEFLAEIM